MKLRLLCSFPGDPRQCALLSQIAVYVECYVRNYRNRIFGNFIYTPYTWSFEIKNISY